MCMCILHYQYFPFCIGISQLKDTSGDAEVQSDLSVGLHSLTLTESAAQGIQSAVRKPNESVPTSADAQPPGVVTDGKPKCEPNQSGGHSVSHVSHLVEKAEVKDDAKSSKFSYRCSIRKISRARFFLLICCLPQNFQNAKWCSG